MTDSITTQSNSQIFQAIQSRLTHSVEELVVSVEDQLGRELPFNRLPAILEIFLQLVAVRLEALLKRCGDLVSDLHLLEGFLHFTFEKLLWLQEITCLQT